MDAYDVDDGGLGWSGLPAVLNRTAESAAHFAPLRCHGFSYAFTAAPAFRLPFPRRVDLRCALHLPATLDHPAGVTRALRRARCQHVTSGAGRCAGFALGSTRREAHGLVWYVYVLQSDLALLGRPALREYLRGWRKVLFACVLNAARAAGAAEVCLAPAEAVFGAAALYRGYDLRRLPQLWTAIYDRTAREFGMQERSVEPAVNIQAVPRRRAHQCARFYGLTLGRAARAPG